MIVEERTIEYGDAEQSWGLCPSCGSMHIEGGSVSIEGEHAIQHCWCSECGSDWDEVYNAAFQIVREPVQKFRFVVEVEAAEKQVAINLMNDFVNDAAAADGSYGATYSEEGVA